VRRRSRGPSRRLLGFALAVVLCAALLVGSMRRGDQAGPATALAQADPAALVPDGPPRPQVMATAGALQVDVPIRQGRVTAIVFHGTGNQEAIPLRPSGRQRNASFATRLVASLFGDSSSDGPSYYLDDAAAGPDTASVDVGAPAATSVYSPVDGTIVGIQPYVLSGRAWGSVIQIRPVQSPATLLTLTNVMRGRRLAVGDTVTAATSVLGTVADLSSVLDQDLARFTSDSGNHVHIELTPAPAVSTLF
jgi:hypothetical protein